MPSPDRKYLIFFDGEDEVRLHNWKIAAVNLEDLRGLCRGDRESGGLDCEMTLKSALQLTFGDDIEFTYCVPDIFESEWSHVPLSYRGPAQV